MNQIQMWAEEGRIVIVLMPEVEKWTKGRRILPEGALSIAALMMRSGHLPNTMTVTGDPEMVCQVTGGTDKDGVNCAWLGIQTWGYLGDRDLVAYIEGDRIRDIGYCLHQLCMEVMHPTSVDGESSIFTREVAGFFLGSFEAEDCDIIDLNSVDPQHP